MGPRISKKHSSRKLEKKIIRIRAFRVDFTKNCFHCCKRNEKLKIFRESNSRRSTNQTMKFQERKEQKFQKLIFCKKVECPAIALKKSQTFLQINNNFSYTTLEWNISVSRQKPFLQSICRTLCFLHAIKAISVHSSENQNKLFRGGVRSSY